uniref:Uncharacterized protein n=1 Tax=Rhizophora mucronata TaxID=61149 RepID=A0A2P2L040_RHIMU
MPLGIEIQLFSISQRCLFSTESATVNSESSKKPEEAKSDGGDKSGDSHQGSDAGKPVRGGVISSRMIFFFMVFVFRNNCYR